MTAPVQVSVVTRILNKAKAIVATVGAALTALSVLLPEGDYKGYVAFALVVVTGIGTFLTKNAATIDTLSGDVIAIVPNKHEAPDVPPAI